MTRLEIRELLEIKERELKEYQKAFKKALQNEDWEHVDQYFSNCISVTESIMNLKSNLI